MTNKAPAPMRNPIVDAEAWHALRQDCRNDPGAFHGGLAKRHLHWLLPDQGEAGVWAAFDADAGAWSGWDAKTGEAVKLDLEEAFDPWARALNDDAAPVFRWFEGALTNAAFNEVDRHVLAGAGEEAALIYEGDRWNMSSNDGRGGPVDAYEVSRRRLLLESAKCAVALKSLGLKAGDRIALNMPDIPEQI